jgi:hypothetical protein
MAYNYTNPGWNNSNPPALNATNLNNISTLLAALGAAFDNGGDPAYIYGGSASLGTGWLTALQSSYTTLFQGQRVLISSGSGNWIVPAGVYLIRVKCIGGGGGGGGTSGNGGSGGNTTFTGATTGIGGGGGGAGNTGTGSGGGGGGAGYDAAYVGAGTYYVGYNHAGVNASGIGCGGSGASGSNYYGNNGGYFGFSGLNAPSGGAGGSGGGNDIPFFNPDIIITTPGSLIAYSVGVGGTAGSGTYVGGTGMPGLIIIDY